LAPCADGYERWLVARGYSRGTVQCRLWQLGQLSGWLQREGLAVGELNAGVAARCAVALRQAGYRSYVTGASMRVPLAYLREFGAVPAPAAGAGPVEELLADFRVYLASERGLVAGTVRNYERAARTFLEDRVARVGELELGRLGAADVSGFLARECPRRSVSGAMDLAAKLRPLLRYLHVAGLIEAPLVWAVPNVADLRGRSLPKGVSPVWVAAMLAGCDPERAIGRRDLAVLLLLWRLGLRAGEVAAIELDDIDWRAGELLVHGKGHREDRMPLPVDVGDALVAYLRVRRASEHRALFLCELAPFGPLTSDVVATIVRRACRRAGVPEVGPHRLRHTAATEMLRARCSLEEIAQVLRHRQLESTALYARVDVDSLRALALPWPGGRS
jgi:integrase/recombinase XerD